MENIEQSDHDLLLRIDERTRNIVNSIHNIKTNYVRNDQFFPVQKIVYGMVAVMLLSVIGAIVTLVIK